MKKKLKVLFLASEMVPFAKTGGLADVAGALPLALEKKEVDVRVAIPKYKCLYDQDDRATIGEKITVYFIRNDRLFKRDGIYGDSSGDFQDNAERFSVFCQEVLSLVKKERFAPDIIHCNDWHTALVPVYLKTLLRDDPFFAHTRTLFTIHNLSYQGLFSEEMFSATGLPAELFSLNGVEYYGDLNLMKGGILFADAVSTVSYTYAREILTEQCGCGLEGVLSLRKDDLTGILNGIDYHVWDPQHDPAIARNYSYKTIEDKYENKEALQYELGLPVGRSIPMIGSVSRLAEQKGLDLVYQAMDHLMRLGIQMVVLGTGDERYHRMLQAFQRKYRGLISVNLAFNALLSAKVYAASDLFLMPSKFEPCGLGQLISFRYGTIPVVRRTGGLQDTVQPYVAKTGKGNGFVFSVYTPEALVRAVQTALHVYKKQGAWKRLIKRVMRYDFSWEHAADAYIRLYRRLAKSKPYEPLFVRERADERRTSKG